MAQRSSVRTGLYDTIYQLARHSFARNVWNKFRLAISGRGLIGLHKKLVLTYDNKKLTDGAGAQLQRIYGIYSISRLLGASYIHSPLDRVDYQGLSALEENAADPGFHHLFNDLCQIKSDVIGPDDFHIINLPDISLEILHQLVAMFDGHETGGRPILVQLALPYGIADRFPDCYEVCKEISPFALSVRKGGVLRVAVHVRRGDLFVVDSDRMLPNIYYINVAQNVAHVLKALKIDYQLELHTEVPNKKFIVHPDYPGISNRISAAATVSPEMCRIDEFSVLPNLVRCINEPAIDSLRKLATADILVMSRSSFSYLGGILNRNGIILYHPFWHRSPTSWVTVGPTGKFNQLKFKKAVKNLRKRVRI
jgi:hypothetical protein